MTPFPRLLMSAIFPLRTLQLSALTIFPADHLPIRREIHPILHPALSGPTTFIVMAFITRLRSLYLPDRSVAAAILDSTAVNRIVPPVPALLVTDDVVAVVITARPVVMMDHHYFTSRPIKS